MFLCKSMRSFATTHLQTFVRQRQNHPNYFIKNPNSEGVKHLCPRNPSERFKPPSSQPHIDPLNEESYLIWKLELIAHFHQTVDLHNEYFFIRSTSAIPSRPAALF